jgi:hypothetical protein
VDNIDIYCDCSWGQVFFWELPEACTDKLLAIVALLAILGNIKEG